jgi:hypothetical protein
MNRDAAFKKVVRRHAEETGQRHTTTEALADLEGLEARMFHQPVAERLLAHLRTRYGIDQQLVSPGSSSRSEAKG